MLRNEYAHKDEAEWTCGTYTLIGTWGFDLFFIIKVLEAPANNALTKLGVPA